MEHGCDKVCKQPAGVQAELCGILGYEMDAGVGGAYRATGRSVAEHRYAAAGWCPDLSRPSSAVEGRSGMEGKVHDRRSFPCPPALAQFHPP